MPRGWTRPSRSASVWPWLRSAIVRSRGSGMADPPLLRAGELLQLLPLKHFRDVHLALVLPYAVHQDKLSVLIARLSPGEEERPVGRVFVHAAVAVAVGDVEVTIGRKADVGGMVEWWPRVLHYRVFLGIAGVGGFVPLAEREQVASVVRELEHELGAAVDQVDHVVRPNADAMGVHEDLGPPGPEQFSALVEDHVRVLG